MGEDPRAMMDDGTFDVAGNLDGYFWAQPILKGFRATGCYAGAALRSAESALPLHLSPVPNPDDPLDHLLERWRDAPPPLPESVAPEVWRRIAAADEQAQPGGWARIAEAFARPSFAVAFVAACVLLGLFLAEIRVSRLQNERSAQLAKSYLQLIDPLLVSDSPARGPSAPRS